MNSSNPSTLNRRAALIGAGASTVALAVPSAAPLAEARHLLSQAALTPLELAKFHASEARKAMAELTDDNWVFNVDGRKEPDFILIRRVHKVAGGVLLKEPLPGIDYEV